VHIKNITESYTRFSNSLISFILLETFQLFTKICGDIHNFVFTDGVVDTDGELFTGVTHDTSDISPVSLLPATNFRQCH
jgi:hypothetical protein